MIVGYEIVHICNTVWDTTKSFYKLLFPSNELSVLHRWNSPHDSLDLQICDPDEYFVQNTLSPSFIQSLQTTQNSTLIMEYLFINKIFKEFEVKYNYAFNIFDLNLCTVFEARIITCFYKGNINNCIQPDIFWDLFIDHLNVHIYVSSNVLRRLMSSTYVGTILGFYINHKLRNSISNIHNELYTPRKTTIILTIDKNTLNKQFNYDNNVLELQKPSLVSNNLTFHHTPLHIGNGIILSQQSTNFEDDKDNKIIKLHKKKKNRLYQCRMIIICNKKELSAVVNHPSSKLHLNFISISEKTITNPTAKLMNVLDNNFQSQQSDEYAILLIAANPKRSSNVNKYPLFDENIAESIKEIRHPNVKSNDGKKHNKSYGKYFGFGIINKYKIDLGISFGEFESQKCNNDYVKNQISDMMQEQFSFFITRLNSIVKHSFESGNEQIDSLINYGRLSTFNQKFIDETDEKKFICDKCFSTWLCQNARTEEFHQEVDSSYTLIGVPIKNNGNMQKPMESSRYKFQFRWNHIEENYTCGFDIGLYDGTVLYYNGITLFHRQVPCSPENIKQSFWNLSIYHNYRLYNSISKSINRN